MAGPVKWSGEALVNTASNGYQMSPRMAALDTGRYVVAWEDWGRNPGDTSSHAVRAQMFNADGSRFGSEFLVNTVTADFQNDPSLTGLSGGRFVIAFKDGSESFGDTSDHAVRAQFFSADGGKDGREFVVNTTTYASQLDPDITTLTDGRIVMTWVDESGFGGDSSGYGIKAQIFTAAGVKSGAEFRINTTTEGWQNNPKVTALQNGNFVVSWSDSSITRSDNQGDSGGAGIRAQVVRADGSLLGAEIRVNSTTPGDQMGADITALAKGGFVISWDDNSHSPSDPSMTAVRGQVFGTDGAPKGGEFLVNTKTEGSQHDAALTALQDGRFVAVWTDSTADGADSAIHAQVFTATGAKSGAVFSVATTTASTQGTPTVITLADGRFVVSWTDFSATGGDTSGTAIRSQIFDPRQTGVTLAGSTGSDDLRGTGFADQMQGGIGNDALFGSGGKDRLWGAQGKDTLNGGDAADRLTGGSGADRLSGGAGADSFVFAGAADAQGDKISDFQHLTDKIILAEGQFIGSRALHYAGDVSYDRATGILQGDVDGDGHADWSLTLLTKPLLTAADFQF